MVEWINGATKQLPEKATENWMNISQIARKLGKSKKYVKKEILKYFEQYPEEKSTHKKPLLDAANNIVDHYSSEIIVWVKKAMEQLPEKAPEGWMNALQLTIYLGKSKDFLIKKVEKYFEQHPEKIDTYKKQFLDSSSRITIFYSPEIVVWLKKEVG